MQEAGGEAGGVAGSLSSREGPRVGDGAPGSAGLDAPGAQQRSGASFLLGRHLLQPREGEAGTGRPGRRGRGATQTGEGGRAEGREKPVAGLASALGRRPPARPGPQLRHALGPLPSTLPPAPPRRVSAAGPVRPRIPTRKLLPLKFCPV